MARTKATLNKEEYKGFLKLFLQRSNCALGLRLSSVLLTAALLGGLILASAVPVSATFNSNNHTYDIDSGTKLFSTGQTSAISAGQNGVFTLSFHRTNAPSTLSYALVGAGDSVTPVVAQIFGDTMAVIKGVDAGGSATTVNDTFIVSGDTDGAHDTLYLTSDTAGTNDTLSYTLSIANYGNGSDSIGLIVDTVWLSAADTTTTGRFSYQFFNKRGDTLTTVLTATQQETGLIGISPTAATAETAMLRIYTKGTVNADTIRVAVRAMANNGTGRVDTAEVNSYRGLNGIRYGGSGNAATYIEVAVSGPLLRLAETDTVFSPVALSATASDTQRYIPGSLIVYTLWFDNDGNDTGDTIGVEYWIDTRHVRFDSQGLSQLNGVSQVAAAGTYVIKGYGNIFLDSAMPTFSNTGFRVAVEYVNAAGAWADIKTAPTPEAVARIRWTISRNGGVIGASNGDDINTIDSAPMAPTSSGDVDMGFVRFSVVIR